MKLAVAIAAAVACAPASALAAEAPPTEVAPVVVVEPTPLSAALGARGPIPVQTLTAAQLDDSHAVDLASLMARTLAGVYINDIQNNPLQPDVSYRGYTASPLLGTPQGLSVYMDGVRLNQPFGDVVSWDLIPRAAIRSATLVSGSDPLFGLNALGGALSIRTKDGDGPPEASVQIGHGSFGRSTVEVEAGGRTASGLHGYLTANRFREDGWRDASPSQASQLFAKAGKSAEGTDLWVSAALADTRLTGNGLQEQRFLARDYASVYTKPDVTRNRAGLLTLNLSHTTSGGAVLTGNLFARRLETHTLNGDINGDALTEALYQPSAAERAVLAANGYSGFPAAGESAANTPFPSWRCIADALQDSEPNEKCDGLLNRTRSRQDEVGASGQVTLQGRLGGQVHHLTAGGALSASRVRFAQSSQFGYLAPDRGVVAVGGPGAFADGSQDSENAFDARVALDGQSRSWSLYGADSIELAPALRLTVSGRFDASRVDNRDRITPAGSGSLSGVHRFSRLNPAVGLVYTRGPALTAYATYNQGSRAPSAIELGCADPANACRLPNALAGDPPLKQVVATTEEAGLRGRTVAGLSWNLGLFRAENRDDILFVADQRAGFGYFKNFGQTRRQGVDMGLSGGRGRLTFDLAYTYLDATYRSAERVDGSANSSSDAPAPGFEGTIAIRPGDRIPLVPRQIFKANAQWTVSPVLSVEADVAAIGGSYARGDEDNLHQPDGVYYLGPGRTAGYAVFNVGSDWRPFPGVKLFVQVNNLFDRRYATGAQLGATGFTDQGAFIARPFAAPVIGGERAVRTATFYAPGAPRMLWFGVRYAIGGR